jgi:hypothetical protein
MSSAFKVDNLIAQTSFTLGDLVITNLTTELVLPSQTTIIDLIPENYNENLAYGFGALESNTTGYFNTSVGYNSLQSNTTGSYNTSMGYNSLQANNIGSYNTSVGENSLILNTEGIHNVSAGYNALSVNTTGSYNTAVGSNTLQINTSGSYNTSIGSEQLNRTLGSYNTAFGISTVKTGNQTKSFNTTIGMNARVDNNIENSTLIGALNSTNNVLSLSNVVKFGTLNILTGNGQNLVSVITGTTTPISTITPNFIGQMYIDTINEKVYLSYNTTNTGWFSLN